MVVDTFAEARERDVLSLAEAGWDPNKGIRADIPAGDMDLSCVYV